MATMSKDDEKEFGLMLRCCLCRGILRENREGEADALIIDLEDFVVTEKKEVRFGTGASVGNGLFCLKGQAVDSD